MKKFLTVLLALSVVFTYTVGTAFAADGNSEDPTIPAVSYDDAQLIKEASAYAQSTLTPASFEKAYKDIVSDKAVSYVTEAAWENVKADIEADLIEGVKDLAESYLSSKTALPTGWDAYKSNIAYTAGKLFPTLDYTTIYGNLKNSIAFGKSQTAWTVEAAKAQFAIDFKENIALYDKIDLDALYSKTTPSTSNSYYTQASKAIENAKDALNEFYFDAKGNVQNAGTSVAQIANEATAVKGWISNGFAGNAGLAKFDGVAVKYWEGTTVPQYYYVKNANIKLLDDEKTDGAVDAATTASLKAKIASNVAVYMADKNASAPEGYTKQQLADTYTALYNYLAEQIPNNNGLQGILNAFKLSDLNKAEHWDKYIAAVDAVKDLNAYAEKYAGEKDATGAYVRDSADVKKIVDAATLDKYASVTNIIDAKVKVGSFAKAKEDIAALSKSGDAAKLVFLKEAQKAVIDKKFEDSQDNYYTLEAAKVKAACEAAKAKVDAATSDDDFTSIMNTLNKEIAKISNKTAVDSLFASGAMKTELDKQVKALNDYVTYKNSALNGATYEDAYVLGGNAANLIRDYYIENGARTAAEMKALTGVVEAVAATLPTTGSVAAAEKAAKDAVKALPSASKITSADKAAVLNAFDLIEAYNKVAKNAGKTPVAIDMSGAKAALQNAIQNDLNLAYAKADKNDKVALKAIAADVKTADKELVGTDKIFSTKFVNPAAAALAKIQAEEKAAVKAAINAIPINVTEADKATVETARKLYDAYIAEYTDYEDMANGYVAADFASEYHELALAEAALGLNEDPVKDVESLKIIASSKAVKGKITVKWRVKGDASKIDGYQVYKSTKAQSEYKFMGKTKKLYMDNKKNLKKGKRYFYKVRAYKVVDGKKYYSDWSNKANRFAK